MGHDERERKFERALERHLRRDAARARTEADPQAVPDEAGGAAECPDAATLAAFHEGTLSNEEMKATTEHIAGCSRCQQVLLLLEATDEIPLQVEIENDLKMGESVLSTGALYVDYAARQTPSLTVAGQPTPASKPPHDISRGRGFKALRWAAPAGAIAAGLLIWIVLRDNKEQTLSHFENVQVAQRQSTEERPPTPRALPTSPAPEPSTKITQLDEKRKDDSRAKQPAKEAGALRAQERYSPNVKAKSANRVAASSSSTTPAPSSGCPTDVPMGSRQCDHLVVLAPPAKQAPQPPKQSTDTVSASAAQIDTSSADLTKQSAVPVPLASSGASANAADKKVEAAPSSTTQTIIDEVPALPTERMATPDKLQAPSFETNGKTALGKKILAPGGTVQWRLRTKGRIERSVDSGVTWAPQSSGVKAELLAGSAPSEAVCWIVGRSGTVLRTTDGGGHWNKVVSPMRGDVAGVQVADAMTAEIFDANKIWRFVTHDGGATWRAAKQ